jgi:hypothetical protein
MQNMLNTLSMRIANISREALAMTFLALGARVSQLPRNPLPLKVSSERH